MSYFSCGAGELAYRAQCYFEQQRAGSDPYIIFEVNHRGEVYGFIFNDNSICNFFDQVIRLIDNGSFPGTAAVSLVRTFERQRAERLNAEKSRLKDLLFR